MYRSVVERLSRAMALDAALKTALYVYAYALLVTICHASPLIKRQKNNSDTQSEKDDDDTTAQTAIGGVILIIAGLILLFFGQRTPRLTQGLTGLYLGAAITYIALANAEPDDGYSDGNDQTIFLVVMIAAGLLVGAGLVWFAVVAIWAFGALTGYIVVLYMLAWADNGMIKSRTAQAVMFGIAIVLCVGAIIYKKSAMISLFTAFVGAFSLMLGIDLFFHSGFARCVRAFSDREHDITYDVDKKVYGILGTVEIVFIIGALVQRRFQPNAYAPTLVDGEEEQPVAVDGKRKRWWERRFWK